MAELARVGPLAEADLGDELRPDPVHTPLPHRRALLERRAVLLQRAQPVPQAAQGLGIEPRADLPGVDQLAVRVVVAEQQRAESDPGTLRVGEAADHEFLAAFALELQPVLVAPAHVRRAGQLGDQPFPAVVAGLRVEGLAVAYAVLGVPQRVTVADRARQNFLALEERPRPGVLAGGVHHVEHVVHHGHGTQQFRVRMDEAEPVLQPLEPGLRAEGLGDPAPAGERAVLRGPARS